MNSLYGAIIGDIVGSRFEHNNIKTKDFEFITDDCKFTDDTVMTIAVANALIKSNNDIMMFKPILIEELKYFGRKYSNVGYGGSFLKWLFSDDTNPYNSWGNGSAMRVSACGLYANTLIEAITLAKQSAEVTHNHPEGIKGAKAIASAIFLTKTGKTKEEIKEFIATNFYNLNFTLDKIRTDYKFDVSCQGSVPQAIVAFLEGNDFEDVIRNAISIGGDSDTIAAMAGSIASVYFDYNITNDIITKIPKEFIDIIEKFDESRGDKNMDMAEKIAQDIVTDLFCPKCKKYNECSFIAKHGEVEYLNECTNKEHRENFLKILRGENSVNEKN